MLYYILSYYIILYYIILYCNIISYAIMLCHFIVLLLYLSKQDMTVYISLYFFNLCQKMKSRQIEDSYKKLIYEVGVR